MKTNSTSAGIIRLVCPVCYNMETFSTNKGIPDCCNCCGALWGGNDSLSRDEILGFHRQWCEKMLTGIIQNATTDVASDIAKILMAVRVPGHSNIFSLLRRKLDEDRNKG